MDFAGAQFSTQQGLSVVFFVCSFVLIWKTIRVLKANGMYLFGGRHRMYKRERIINTIRFLTRWMWMDSKAQLKRLALE